MNCNASTSVLLVLLITGITLLGSCGFVTAEETSSSTDSPDVQVVPLSGTIIPVDDGKEIHWVEEGSPLEINMVAENDRRFHLFFSGNHPGKCRSYPHSHRISTPWCPLYWNIYLCKQTDKISCF